MSTDADQKVGDRSETAEALKLVRQVLDREFAELWTGLHQQHNKRSADIAALYRDVSKVHRRVERLQKRLFNQEQKQLLDIRNFRDAVRFMLSADLLKRRQDTEPEE